MLFNSYEFIFLFLPFTLLGYYLLTYKWPRENVSLGFLVIMSLFFYGWWNYKYLFLLLTSLFVNYSIGRVVRKKVGASRLILALGIAFNIALICYFKYLNFFIDIVSSFTSISISTQNILLPLAISFFTFQQISFLVESYQGKIKNDDPLSYILFVTFFPQLIAGPIVHHQEIIPQFENNKGKGVTWEDIGCGVIFFIYGLFKKVIIADTVAGYSNNLFDVAVKQGDLTFFGAWTGAAFYSFQIYFDFSGYSDMAYGLGRFFGVSLPVNFFSPYKAKSIIEFWRTWHMTLSRFLRDYLYIPLGGNRVGKIRKHLNLLITMLLGGLWHGAGWNFILWGGLHGLFLIINHAWRFSHQKFFPRAKAPLQGVICNLITLLCVVFAWVPFRAESITDVRKMYEAMLGLNGILIHPKFTPVLKYLPDFVQVSSSSEGWVAPNDSITFTYLFPLLFVVFFLPNIFEYLRGLAPIGFKVRPHKIKFRGSSLEALLLAVLTTFVLSFLNAKSEFLYFQF